MNEKSVWVRVKSYTTEDYWDGEAYGDWRVTKEYSGASVHLTRDGEIGYRLDEVEVPFEPKADQVVWVVVVEYSTGNTFGHESGATHVVGVYDDGVVASIVKGKIEDDYKNNYRGSNEIKVEGQPDIYTYTWKGYFESLENVHVERVHINP